MRRFISISFALLLICYSDPSLNCQISGNFKLPKRKTSISSTNELTQVTIKSMVRDKNGFVWIGTQDGLNRYDGKRIKQYRYNPKKKKSLCGNHISTLFKDSQDRIWVGTINRGLCIYDSQLDSFRRPNIKSLENHLLNTSIITNITEDSKSRIWISTSNFGLHCLIPNQDHTYDYNKCTPANINEQFTSVYIGLEDQMWLGTDEGIIYKADLKKEYNEIKFTILTNEINNTKINCFLEDEFNLWIGSENGFYQYKKHTKICLFYDLNTGGTTKTRSYDIYALVKDSNDMLWIGAGHGLYCLTNDEDNKPIFYNKESTFPISHNTVYSLMSEEDQLWIGTAKNIDIFDFSKEDFHVFNDKSHNGLNNPIIFSIYKESSRLWIGTAGGLNLLMNDTSYYFTRDEFNQNAIADNVIRSIQLDSKGNLWFGTTNGLSVINLETFDPKHPKFVNHYFHPDNNTSISGNNIRDMLLDKNGILWVTTYGQGINRFIGNVDRNDFKFERINNNTHSLTSNYVLCISEDPFGRIWVGTQNGINRITFDQDKIEISPYFHDPNNEYSISDNFIHEIFFDQDSVMWIATKFGFNRSDNFGKTYISFHLSDGLPNEVIYSIQEDDFGSLWLGTNNGLVSYNKEDNTFFVYNKQDGIADNEFDLQAHFKDKNGLIYMGGINGVNVFYPPDLIAAKEPTKTLISDILISNTNLGKISIHDEIQMNHLYMDDQNLIEINHDNFPLFIHLASPSSKAFTKIQYYYKLLPKDNEWNDLSDRSELQVLNLPSGQNSILICGGTRSAIWENNTTKLTIYVKPPWWKSNIAYLTYFVSLCASIYLFMNLILKRKEAIRESIRLKNLEENKSRFYANITHEFRTPLTVILGMLDNVLSSSVAQDFDKVDHSVKLIRRNGLQLLNLVNQLLDLTKLRKGQYKLSIVQADVIVYIKYLIKNLHSFGQVNNVQLVDYIEEEHLEMDFDPKALEQILTNLIGNAIKFSNKDSNVIIHVFKETTPANLVIKVKDYGNGIPENEFSNIFERFYQIDDGLKQPGGSSGLGLSMVKELIELLNGKISVKSKVGMGCEFILHIPITHQAELKPLIYTLKEKINISRGNKEIEFLNEDSEIILIVEDNKDIASYISICLNDRFTIKYCENGLLGLEAAIEIMPDIIISDVMMPKMDGYELCSNLKSNELTNHIPIIILTARVDEHDRLHGLNCGADAYLNKPFNPEELSIRIEQLIKLRKDMKSKFSHVDILQEHKNNTKRDPNENFLNKAIKIVFENIDDNEFRSIHLAKAMNVSETQLYRKLKALTDQSTAIFIRSIRLKQSKFLLQTTSLSISEVAYDTGFSDPAYFSRVFKNTYGISPNKIRLN